MIKLSKVIICSALSCLLYQNGLSHEKYKTIKEITGAGSSFIYPVMSKWTNQYSKDRGVKVNYQSIGSGGGIAQFKANTVEFAATDEPLKIQELNKINAIQFPMVISGIVPIYHLNIHYKDPKKHHDKPHLTLSGPVLADIYLGNIKQWDDPKITKLNPEINIPKKLRIISIHRADGSGTTFNFSHYLASVSPEWAKTVGYATAVRWKGLFKVGAKGNAGVAAQVKNIPNSIGYVEFAYAKSSNLEIANMYNQDNKKSPIIPNIKSFADAANNAKWSQSNGFYQILTNQPGVNSWPIVATTFIIMPKPNTPKTKKLDKPGVNEAMLCFFNWAFENGNKMATELNYIGMPQAVQNKIRQVWAQNHSEYKDSCH